MRYLTCAVHDSLGFFELFLDVFGRAEGRVS